LNRVVTLLQTCSTSEFVYDHAWFCVYVYLWTYLPCMRENVWLSCFWVWLTSLNMMSSSCIYLPSNHMSLFLMAELYSIGYLYYIFLIQSSIEGTWVVSRAWLLWIVLQWTSMCRCLYCILTYVLLGRCPGVVSLDHMVLLSLAFWGISMLLSIVVVLICIPSNSV
jgi:hypothetical protein